MTASDTYRFGSFVLDTRRWCLERDGVPVPLQPQVFKTLLYLVRHPGRVIPKQELFAELWPGTMVTDGVLTRCVKELRQALGDDARTPRFIRTVSRVGYAFEAGVLAGSAVRDIPLAVAVLPFKPVAATARDEALELGLADDLINQLSSLRGVVVRPLAAVRRYGNLDHDPLSAGKEQRTNVVVEGSLRQRDDTLSIALRVLNVSDATSLMSETFEETFASLRTLQQQMGQKVASALALVLMPRRSESLGGRSTDSPRAHRCFLLGRLSTGRHTPDGDRAGIELLRQAVREDPGYARAWAALAESISLWARSRPTGVTSRRRGSTLARRWNCSTTWCPR